MIIIDDPLGLIAKVLSIYFPAMELELHWALCGFI